ncbi:Hint domain-containing protein [uncultured Sulfitobacter sp.]|uniref:Hint domain-containing protein n=1 Tax=uncultured Sulfitobacter sp. TaxID=191468 RepID=UPI0026036BEC|nr:Hint domain-containing protein [uncultured Sulfitobacter sp.]
MPFTIEGVDNEFAVSTGGNVGTTANSSTFDGSPKDSVNLRITMKAGDEDPRLFEIGDVYDVSWSGQGGNKALTDAVVIRSDPSPDGNGTGIIVFEGVDENGAPAQIIWTPGFDAEEWYDNNFNSSKEPQFYTEDMDASYDHRYICFASATRLKTPLGPRTVDTLRAGDLVSTKDSGDLAILWAGQRFCSATGKNAPVVFERGTIGNSAPLRVSQQHRMLIKSPLAQYYFGHDEVFVPAKACVNDHDIRIVPTSRIKYVHVLLEQHHVVWAEGAACESLYLGDETGHSLGGDPAFRALHGSMTVDGGTFSTARHVLKMKEALLLMRHLNGPFTAPQPRAQSCRV